MHFIPSVNKKWVWQKEWYANPGPTTGNQGPDKAQV